MTKPAAWNLPRSVHGKGWVSRFDKEPKPTPSIPGGFNIENRAGDTFSKAKLVLLSIREKKPRVYCFS